jgi:hypothetical protein
VIDRLPGRGTLSIEARGWGRSRDLPGPYTLEQLALDTRDVIADAGVTDYVLVGHSMGGKVAQLVAAARPAGLLGLVLVGSGPAKPAAVVTPEYQEGLSHAYDSDETTAAARDNILTATPLSDDLKAQIVADSRAGAPEARIQWPLHAIAQDITREARNIEVPVLVIAGEHDHVEPVEVLRDNLLPLWVPDTRPHVLTWGDASRMGFGTMGGRDVATRVSDLPAADLLGCSARAFRHVQGRRDLGVAPPTGSPAASGRQAATVVGGSSRHQRTGPGTVHDPSPAAVRHPRHAAALAC